MLEILPPRPISSYQHDVNECKIGKKCKESAITSQWEPTPALCAWEVYQETDAKTELDMQETY